MKYDVFVTKGLGNNSYLVESEGEALVVDPQRDAWRFLELAYERDLNIKYVLETHVHNDYVSGMHQIQDETGAILALPHDGKYEFAHKGMKDGEKIVLGNVIIEAMATPGHTYEHMSWLARDRQTGKEIALFSGGSLIVGSAGRTDLLGHYHHPVLTEHQYKTLQKYKELPRNLAVLPTHGAGSFCTSSPASPDRVTSIGRELQENMAFQAKSLDEFSKIVNSGLKRYPRYYQYMASLNRKGVSVHSSIPLPPLLETYAFLEMKSDVVDVRNRISFAKMHLKDSVNIELTPSFASYLGWLFPIDAKIVLIVPDPIEQNLTEAMTQLFRIGFENSIVGYVTEHQIEKIAEEGIAPVSSFEVGFEKNLRELLHAGTSPPILDVRDPVEFKEVSLKGSVNVFFADIGKVTIPMKEEDIWVLCVSGERSAVAASLLKRLSISPRPLVDGGVPNLINSLNLSHPQKES